MAGEAPQTTDITRDERRHDLLVSGDFDLRLAPEIEQAGLLALSHQAVHELAVDLRDVTFIDSTGIGVLVRLRVTAEELAKQLILTAPSEPVTRLLTITALTSAFTTEQ